MEFRTKIAITTPPVSLRHSSKVMMIGSCFTESIGSRMADAMMGVSINPLGTLYNPASIATAVGRIVSLRLVEQQELIEANGVWNSLDFHSRYSRATREEAIEAMNTSITAAHEHLSRCQAAFITLGTAFVYTRRGVIVGNCHRLPSAQFDRRMLTAVEVAGFLENIATTLTRFNPQLKIVFTVSPIRHLADGLSDNCLSKSTLRVAIDETVKRHQSTCSYFPSYEILVDDLRDYRFYAADMVHPSDVAVEYIWQLLKAACFDTESLELIERCEKMTKRLRHRPMSHNPAVVERFNAETQAALDVLTAQYPYIAGNIAR